MIDNVTLAMCVMSCLMSSPQHPVVQTDYGQQIKTLDGLRPQIESWAGQAGYQQCKQDVRFYVFGVGSKPKHSPNFNMIKIKPVVSYPLVDGGFNLSHDSAGMAFYWKEYEIQTDKEYRFGKYKKECVTVGNKTNCTDYRIMIPSDLIIRVWPGKGHIPYNGSLYNQTEVREFADL